MFKILKTIALSALLTAGLLATPLYAQPPPDSAQLQQLRCGPHDKVTELLDKRYVEKQTGLGVIRQHFLIEVYVSTEGSWTILRTDRLGTACIMATGHSWQHIPLSPGDGV